MHKLFWRLNSLVGRSGITVCLAALASFATAQQGPTQPRMNEQAKSKDARLLKTFEAHLKDAAFTDILRLLVEKYYINVVVDGYPLKLKSDLDVKGTIGAALDVIANSFDFEWMLSRSGIVTMTKRFHNHNDYPQVNALEMRRLSRDITNTLQLVPFDPVPGNSTELLLQLAHMMTETQWQTLRSGEILRGSTMSPEQTTVFQRAAFTSAFAPSFKAWTELANQLDEMPSGYFLAKKYSVNQDGALQPFFDISWIYRSIDGQLTMLGMPAFDTNESGSNTKQEEVLR